MSAGRSYKVFSWADVRRRHSDARKRRAICLPTPPDMPPYKPYAIPHIAVPTDHDKLQCRVSRGGRGPASSAVLTEDRTRTDVHRDRCMFLKHQRTAMRRIMSALRAEVIIEDNLTPFPPQGSSSEPSMAVGALGRPPGAPPGPPGSARWLPGTA